MFFKWIKLALEQYKTVMSLLVLLGISGVSIYGNVNEMNPWATPVVDTTPPEVDTTPIEVTKIIETRVVTSTGAIEAAMSAHIKEFH